MKLDLLLAAMVCGLPEEEVEQLIKELEIEQEEVKQEEAKPSCEELEKRIQNQAEQITRLEAKLKKYQEADTKDKLELMNQVNALRTANDVHKAEKQGLKRELDILKSKEKVKINKNSHLITILKCLEEGDVYMFDLGLSASSYGYNGSYTEASYNAPISDFYKLCNAVANGYEMED